MNHVVKLPLSRSAEIEAGCVLVENVGNFQIGDELELLCGRKRTQAVIQSKIENPPVLQEGAGMLVFDLLEILPWRLEEKRILLRALRICGSVSEAARSLEMGRATVYRRIQRYTVEQKWNQEA